MCSSTWGGADNASFAVAKSYWGPKPSVPSIEFQTNPDPNSALAEVESGQLDVAFGLPPNLISQVKSPAQSEVTPDVRRRGDDDARCSRRRSTSRRSASRSPTLPTAIR